MSNLKTALQKLIAQTQIDMQLTSFANPPQFGVVAQVNGDGTVDVQGAVHYFTGVGNPNPDVTIGAKVLVITTPEGTRTTVPQ